MLGELIKGHNLSFFIWYDIIILGDIMINHKNIFYVRDIHAIGGVETFVYELAKKSGIAHNTIYRWYNMNYTPTLETLQVLCEKGFEISLAEFFAVDCDMIPATKDLKEIAEIWTSLDSKQREAIKQIIYSYK